MGGDCRDCSFYRVARPASELLGAAIGSNDAAVLTALGKIQEDEKELAAQEQSFRAHLQERGQKIWGARPVMSAYCGLQENEGTFYIAQIRNAGFGCNDRETKPTPIHDCASCAHRIAPAGVTEDVQQEQAYAWMTAGKAATGNSASMVENLWKQHLESTGNLRANELRDAYQRKGVLLVTPNYLDYCRHFSSAQRFVLCALQNAHRACPQWAAQSSAPPTGALPRTASDSPGLDVAALFSLSSTAEPEIPDPLRPVVDEFVDFAGCMLGITLTNTQLTALRSQLAQALTDPKDPAIGVVKAAIESFQSVKDGDIRSRHAWRERNQATYLQQLRGANDPLSQLLRRWYEDAAQVLVAGSPPLTREAAESWVELISFVTARSGREQGSALPPDIEGHIAQLAAAYQRLSDQQRSMISLAPITLYELRRAWPAMSATQREAAEEQLGKQLGVAPAPPSAAAMVPPAISLSPRETPDPPPPASVPTDETPLDRLTRELATAQARGDHQQAAKLRQRVQIELQNEAMQLEMENKIAETFYEVSRGIWK